MPKAKDKGFWFFEKTLIFELWKGNAAAFALNQALDAFIGCFFSISNTTCTDSVSFFMINCQFDILSTLLHQSALKLTHCLIFTANILSIMSFII